MAGLRGTGSVEIPTLPPGAITLPDGGFKLADGTLHLPEGATVPEAAFTIPRNSVKLPEGAEIPAGAIDLGDGVVHLPEGMTPPAGSLPIQEGALKLPEGTTALPEIVFKGTDKDGKTVYFAHEYIESHLMEAGIPYLREYPDAWDRFSNDDGKTFDYYHVWPRDAFDAGAHDLSLNEGKGGFGHWRSLGMDASRVEVAPQLANIDDVVASLRQELLSKGIDLK